MNNNSIKKLTTSRLKKRCLSSSEESWVWRDLSLSGEREQPMTEWPLLANSRARAFPSPLLTPVISTVFCPPPPFITTPTPV
ncbi:hypothetical protein Hanom_Chr03g00210821 [Helianthus anomalus]